MNEAKQIKKERQKRVVRKDSRLTAYGVWALVIIEVVRFALPYKEVLLNVVQ